MRGVQKSAKVCVCVCVCVCVFCVYEKESLRSCPKFERHCRTVDVKPLRDDRDTVDPMDCLEEYDDKHHGDDCFHGCLGDLVGGPVGSTQSNLEQQSCITDVWPVVRIKLNAPRVVNGFRTLEKATLIGDSTRRSREANKGHWLPEEDALLREAVESLSGESISKSGSVPWKVICLAVPGRSHKQCRERFVEHLDSRLASDEISSKEASIIYSFFKKHGRKWSKMCNKINTWRARNGYKGKRARRSVRNIIRARDRRTSRLNTTHDETFSNLSDVLDCDDIASFVYGTGDTSNDAPWDALIYRTPPMSPTLVPKNHPTPPLYVLNSVSQAKDVSDAFSQHKPPPNMPPRTCCAERKMQVRLSTGDITSRRSMLEAINKMVNTPHPADTISVAKRQAKTGQRRRRVAKL